MCLQVSLLLLLASCAREERTGLGQVVDPVKAVITKERESALLPVFMASG